MEEKDWIAGNLSYRQRGWEEVLISGRVKLEDCPEPLKSKIDLYLTAFSDLDNHLNSLGYEAG